MRLAHPAGAYLCLQTVEPSVGLDLEAHDFGDARSHVELDRAGFANAER